MITLNSKSILGLKYDIIKDGKIGRVSIPFTRALGSAQFGDISIDINGTLSFIRIPLKGNIRGGFGVSGYQLLKNNEAIAEVTFPPRGSDDELTIKWVDKEIKFKKRNGEIQIIFDNRNVGNFWEKVFYGRNFF